MKGNNDKRILSTILLLILLSPTVLSIIPIQKAQAQNTVLGIWYEGTKSEVVKGGRRFTSFEVEANVTNAGPPNLNGFDITINFNPSILAPVDQDTSAAGVQPAKFTGGLFGVCPASPCFPLRNEVTSPGSIRVAVVLLGATVGATSGTLFFFGFTLLVAAENGGFSIIDINESISNLTNPGAVPYTSIDGFFTNVSSDVGVELVTATPLSVAQGDIVTINVKVRNFGLTTATFTVTTKAGIITVDTKTVSSLLSGKAFSFTVMWNTAGIAAGDYLISATASAITGEFTTTNNTFNDGTVTVTAVVHDVAVTAVSVTPASGTVGDIFKVDVTVQNQGQAAESVTVQALFDSNVIGEQTGSLAIGASSTFTFSWNTAGVAPATYTISGKVLQVPGETDTADNTMADGTVTLSPGVVHDVAVTAITAPAKANLGELVSVKVTVQNQGTVTESFTVNLFLDATMVGSQPVTNLAANSFFDVFFSVSTAGLSTGSHTLRAEIPAVTGETDTADNSKSTTIAIQVHDVAVTAVSAPSKANVGDVVSVKVTVQNQGSETESFTVNLFFDATMVGSQTVTGLAAGMSTDVTFSVNTAGASSGAHIIRAAIPAIPGETDTADNSKEATITLQIHDVAVTGIQAPSKANVGEPITVTVNVQNQGTEAESFTVNLFLDATMVGSTTVTNLAPGTSTSVMFSVSTTGASSGAHTIRAEIPAVAGEIDTADNSAQVTINLQIHDVAVTAIMAPAKANLGDMVSVTVTVQNQGSETESFTVNLLVDGTLVASQMVTGLAAGSSLQVSFTLNTAGLAAGSHTLTAQIPAIAGETDTADNGKDTTIFLQTHDIAVTAIQAPAQANIGDLVSVKVTVQNQGNTAESFTVNLFLDATMVGSKPVSNLAAGSFFDVFFDIDTTGLARGSHTLRAEVPPVAGETDTADNSKTATIALIAHDIAVTAVTPAQTTAVVGTMIDISVTVKNNGDVTETGITVDVFAGATKIGSATIMSLAVGASTMVTVTWATTGFATGDYTISATATLAAGLKDINPGDNTLVDGIVTLTPPPVHDVAVTSVVPSTLSANVGAIITIDVTVQNKGGFSETFTLEVLANVISIGSQSVTLAIGETRTIPFTWDTATFMPDSYVIKATATLAGDVNPGDNTFTDGTVVLKREVLHDVAIASVTPDRTKVAIGDPVMISITVSNLGQAPENVTVQALAGGVVVAMTTVLNLAPGASTTVVLTWNTASFAEGTHIISGKALAVPGETMLANNELANGTVTLVAFRATLTGRSAWPEHHHFVRVKDEDQLQSFFAKVANLGRGQVYAYVRFSLTSGSLTSEVSTTPVLLAEGAVTTLNVKWTTNPAPDTELKWRATATVFFNDSLLPVGDPGWLQSAKVKSFSFAYIP